MTECLCTSTRNDPQVQAGRSRDSPPARQGRARGKHHQRGPQLPDRHRPRKGRGDRTRKTRRPKARAAPWTLPPSTRSSSSNEESAPRAASTPTPRTSTNSTTTWRSRKSKAACAWASSPTASTGCCAGPMPDRPKTVPPYAFTLEDPDRWIALYEMAARQRPFRRREQAALPCNHHRKLRSRTARHTNATSRR